MDTPNTASETPSLKHHECVAAAAVDMLGATCGVQLEPREDDEALNTDGVIIAIISLLGDVDWSVFLGLPRDTAVGLAANFAGFEIPFDSPDMGDAIGELANILAGEVKNRLDKRGLRAEISLPGVIRAESPRVLDQHNIETVKMCFASQAGPLWTGVIAQKRDTR